MAKSKLFTVVGVSRIRSQDPMKLRVANGGADGRAKRLTRGGHVEVNLFDTEPMTKQAALDWLELNHPQLAAQIGSKQVKAVRAKVAKVVAAKPKAVKKVAKPKVEAPVVEAKVEVTEGPLSPAAKLALKRIKDAARKREKRAAERAAKEAAKAVA
jgi:hypothetical protein